MGVGQSGLLSSGDATGPRLEDLPENCVAEILRRLSPPDICKLAEVNKTFYRASLGNIVWETKLPSNYEFLVRKLLCEFEFPTRVSKKDIYHRLSQPIRFDGGTKEIWVERRNGKMWMAVSWKGMSITGIDDRRYWSHIPTQESRFHAIAYLKQVRWLEVGGQVNLNFPTGTYSLYFRIRLGKPSKRFDRQRVCDLDRVHGWDIKPVRLQFSTSNGQQATSECFLKEVGSWCSYHVGSFTVENHQVAVSIKFTLAQIDCTHPKGGLCLDYVIIEKNIAESYIFQLMINAYIQIQEIKRH